MNRPLPEMEERALALSPPPAHTTAGFEGAMATAPTEAMPTLSVTTFHVVPALVVFHNPPLRVAA